ncbi:hypothetical protein NMY22_g3162 [Coprinellus aureogranulatus]|nr:hypothetical protein NMY22_g3162 [Coprinellus aureogranulatus]
MAATAKVLETDLVIVMMGVSGSGKSTFINNWILDKRKTMYVEKDTTLACTTAVTHTIIDSNPRLDRKLGLKNGQRLVMVDTPGFNYGNDKRRGTRTDLSILQEIQTYLDKCLPGTALNGGVIYLHDLSVDPQPPRPIALDRLTDTSFRSQLLVVATKGSGEDKAAQRKFDSLRTQTTALKLPLERLLDLEDSNEASKVVHDFLERIQGAGGFIDIANMNFSEPAPQNSPRKRGLRNFFSKLFKI